MSRGDDADVRLRIRAQDDGGLRLLAAYRAEVARLRRDIADLNRSGQLRNERGQFLSKDASQRVVEANNLRRVQNQAFAEQDRNIQREQQAFSRSFQARSQGQRRIAAAEAQAHAEGQRRATQANNTNQQFQQAQIKFQQRLAAAHQQALQANARLTRGSGGTPGGTGANTAQLEQEDRLWQRLRNSVIAYWIARQAGSALVGFVREGLQFNQILETAQLGIASLITATSKVRDNQNNILTGGKALAGAYSLAADQMNKIRIAGLQTAATTEQLVDAFQQALGPGLKAGLNLDQIRQITVQIVQAAGAIGLPFNQLNQEVRSILDATIDRNSRVARVLSITNEEVRQAREQGRLAEFLNEKMQAFTVAGGQAAKTMFVLKSNIKEAFQVFAGQSTQDLFAKMRDSLQAVFADAFDFKNLRIAEKFQGLVQAIQTVFSGVGDLFVSTLQSLIHGAETLSGWFERNKIQVGLTVTSFVELSRQLGGALADAISFLGTLVGISTQTNVIALSVKIIADGIGVIRNNAALLLAVFVGTRLAVLAVSGALTGGVIPAMERLILLVRLNPWLAVALTLGTILALTIAAREAEALHFEMVTRTAEALARQRGEDVSNLAKLTREYQTNATALEKTTKGTEAYEQANDALKRTYDELLKLAPDLRTMADFEGKSIKERTELLKKMTQARLQELAVQSSQATIAAAEAENALAAERAKEPRFGGASGLLIDNSGRINQLEQAANAAQRVATASFKAVVAASAAVNQATQSLFRLDTGPSKTKTKGAANDPQQIRAAALETAKAEFDVQKAELQRELEFEEITRTQFHDKLIEQINIRADAEIAAHRKLLAVTKDDGERKKINADIVASEKQRIQDIATFERDENRESRRQAKAAIIEQAKDVRDAITESNQRVKAASQSIAQRVFQGEITSRQGAEEFKGILAEEVSKTLELIATLEVLRRTINDPKQVDVIDEMVTRLQGHLTDLDRQVLNSDRILQLFGQRFRNEVESTLADAFTDIVTRAKSVGQAFRDMAASIIRDIAQIINRMIAMRIVEGAIGLFSFPGLDIRAASGGLILGPGTGTSDSIPARLSSGEYVMRASAVKSVGVDTLDMINYGATGGRLRSRNGGYAGGGLVESAARSGGISNIRIGLDRGLILETMRSTDGARIHVEHAQRHRNKLRQVSSGQ